MQSEEYSLMKRERGGRESALRRMGFSSYKAYLGSTRWQDKRRAYFASDRPQKCICGETEYLQLHHLTYERVGNESLDDLRVLCPGCHNMLHVLEQRGDSTLDPATIGEADAKPPLDAAEVATRVTNARNLPISEALPTLKAIAAETDYPYIYEQFHAIERLIAKVVRTDGGRRDFYRRILNNSVAHLCDDIPRQVEVQAQRERELARVFDQSRRPAHRLTDTSGTMSGRWAGWRTEAPATPVVIKAA